MWGFGEESLDECGIMQGYVGGHVEKQPHGHVGANSLSIMAPDVCN